jgi:hypothetical protein
MFRRGFCCGGGWQLRRADDIRRLIRISLLSDLLPDGALLMIK